MLAAVDALSTRIADGKPTLVLGTSFVQLPPLDGTVVRISCDVPRETFGPLLALSHRIDFLLGDAQPLFESARSQVLELGRRVLNADSGAPRGALGQIVHGVNRLAKGSACVVLDALDAADEATLDALRQILARPGWLKVPLVLGMRTSTPEGAPAELAHAVRQGYGDQAVLELAPPPPPASFSIGILPPETRTVLRAAAVLGPAFELTLLSAVLAREPFDLLLQLQLARDVGLVIEDRGNGTFALDPGQAALLAQSLLPSLRTVIHRRAGELLSAPEEEPAPEESPVSIQFAQPALPDPEPSAEPDRTQAPVDADPPPPPPAPAPAAPTSSENAAPAPSPSQAGAPSPRPQVPGPFTPLTPAARALSVPHPTQNHARASEHLFESGDFGAAAQRALLAAGKAAGLGANAQAERLARRSLEAAIRVPDVERSRRLRVLALIAMGRIRLEGYAPGGGFDLNGALEPLEAAARALAPEDPPELAVEIAQLLAVAHGERGDKESLERALEGLAETSRALLARGHAAHAARLLNDQAAVYMRLGDPVRAVALLEQSRHVFESRPAGDPVAALELAETDHLIAKVPLHVPARPGREEDAVARAIEHATAAKRTFDRLGDSFASARALETLGRLELLRGEPERAVERLRAALALQEKKGDLVGLARTTAALSDTLLGLGRGDEALLLLADSVTLNHQKGSVLGVALNRRSFSAALRALGPEARGPGASDVEARLRAAEEELGTLVLPGERDAPN